VLKNETGSGLSFFPQIGGLGVTAICERSRDCIDSATRRVKLLTVWGAETKYVCEACFSRLEARHPELIVEVATLV